MAVRVLSFFDGCATALQALLNCNVPVAVYDAIENDLKCIAVAKHNYPAMEHVGELADAMRPNTLLKDYDLIIGGFPCQDLSIANPKRQGFSGQRSSLFFQMLQIMESVRYKYFVIENVASMKKEHRDIVSTSLGVAPTFIDSQDFVPQIRKRLYWTNFPILPWQSGCPRTQNLHNILEHGVVDRQTAYCIDANYGKGTHIGHYKSHRRRQLVFKDSTTMTANGLDYPYWQQMRVGDDLTHIKYKEDGSRILTPLECERCQGFPDNYTKVDGIANTHRYRMIGNAFTVPVIEHIIRSVQSVEANKKYDNSL